MRAVAGVVAVFALLAFDLTKNDGEWFASASELVSYASHDLRTAFIR